MNPITTAASIFEQNDGAVTKAYYERLKATGPAGQLAVALFRAQKRSTAAKGYRRLKFRRDSYDVKQWSLSEVARVLLQHDAQLGITWGWKQDPHVDAKGARYTTAVDGVREARRARSPL